MISSVFPCAPCGEEVLCALCVLCVEAVDFNSVTAITDTLPFPAHTGTMKRDKVALSKLGPYGEASFCIVSFSLALAVLFWLVHISWGAAFRAWLGH